MVRRVMMKKIISRRLVILLIILGIAGFLRSYHLKERGLFCFDEAWYLCEAKFVLSQIKNPSFIQNLSKERDLNLISTKLDNFGIPLTNAKPGHILLLVLLSLIIGLKDYTTLILSSASGVIMIYLVYLLGKGIYEYKTGLLASLFLAVMPYHLYYSYSGLPEADSMVFFYIGFLLYYLSLKSKTDIDWRLILSAFSISFAITCNYRWPILLPLFLCSEVYIYLIRRRNPDAFFKRLFVSGLSFILLPLAFELYTVYTLLSNPVLQILQNYAYAPTYFQRIAWMLSTSAPIVPGSKPYLLYLWGLIGPGGCLFLLGGVFYLIKRHTLEDFLILGVFVIPLFLYSFATSYAQGPRVLSITLPAIAIIMARAVFGINDYFQSLDKKRLLKVLLVILIGAGLFWSISEDIKILKLKCNYKKAIQYIIDHGSPRYLSTSHIQSLFYQGGGVSAWPPYTFEDLKMAHAMGYRYLVLDQRRYTERYRLPLVRYVQSIARPCYEIPNSVGEYWVFFYEEGVEVDLIKSVLAEDKSLDKILIYDLDDIFKRER